MGKPEVRPQQDLYQLPQEVSDMFASAEAMRALRDRYIGVPVVGYYFARRAALQAEKELRKAWLAVYELWPELRTKLVFEENGMVIFRTAENGYAQDE